MPEIVPANNLEEYFMDAFGSARRKARLDVADDTEFYVVKMLSGFVRDNKFQEEALVGLMAAAEEDERKAYVLSKRIGDACAFTCGIFLEWLESRGIFDCYIRVGRGGYSLAASFPGPAKRIFKEMSEKLPGIVDTLNWIGEDVSALTDGQVFDIYQKWLRTRSKRLRRTLERSGMHLTDSSYSIQ